MPNSRDPEELPESDSPDPSEVSRARSPIPGERYDLQILQSLRRIIRAIDIHSRRLKLSHDITGPQLVCLITIVEKGPLTIKQIANEIFLSPSTVIGILDRLEAKGLILRLRGTRDRRVVNVSTTPTGITVVEEAPSPLQEGLARALKNLREIEQATIALSLERIVELMEAKDLPADPVLETSPRIAEPLPKNENDETDEPTGE